MSPGDEFASTYDRVTDLTSTTDMSGSLQPQFVARMLGAEPADVVALHSLRRRLQSDPDDLELAAEAERALGTLRELLASAEEYATRQAERDAGTPAAGRSLPIAADSGTDADELECLAFADAVDWLLETTGVEELRPDERVEALAHALRTPRDRIRAVTDAHAAVTDPDVAPGSAVLDVRAARPVLDRLVDRAEHGDVHEPPPTATRSDGAAGGASAAGEAGPAGIDELSRLAREQIDIPMAGTLLRRFAVAAVLLLVVAVVIAVVLAAAG